MSSRSQHKISLSVVTIALIGVAYAAAPVSVKAARSTWFYDPEDLVIPRAIEGTNLSSVIQFQNIDNNIVTCFQPAPTIGSCGSPAADRLCVSSPQNCFITNTTTGELTSMNTAISGNNVTNSDRKVKTGELRDYVVASADVYCGTALTGTDYTYNGGGHGCNNVSYPLLKIATRLTPYGNSSSSFDDTNIVNAVNTNTDNVQLQLQYIKNTQLVWLALMVIVVMLLIIFAFIR